LSGAIAISCRAFRAYHVPEWPTGWTSVSSNGRYVRLDAVFGVFRVLFWRYGLEAAMIAHATTHIFSTTCSNAWRT